MVSFGPNILRSCRRGLASVSLSNPWPSLHHYSFPLKSAGPFDSVLWIVWRKTQYPSMRLGSIATNCMTAVDTNILFYAHDNRDPLKRQIARSLIHSLDDGVLLWQVSCEYLSASRKLEPQGYSFAAAMQYLNELRAAWPVALPTAAILDRIPALRARGFSNWDALLVGACLEAHVNTLFSEDFREVSRIGSLEIVNPFSNLG